MSRRPSAIPCAPDGCRARGVTDPFWAGGIVLCDGQALPVVLCIVDWCEISNRSHLAWREVLATAVGTRPERVTVHTMHPHCTPWPDAHAQRLVEGAMGVDPIMDVDFCDQAMQNAANAARVAIKHLQSVTHMALGKAKVEQVASNRRIMGEDGKIKAVRWTTTLDPEVRAEPEGETDPYLKNIGFWNGEAKLATLHFYAVHPSSYEDSFVTPDFTGLAREQRIHEDGGVPHSYFTECAGDITAGKYNDGVQENRELFTARIHGSMLEAERTAQRVALTRFEWKSVSVCLPAREDEPTELLQATLRNNSLHNKTRSRAALALSYRERLDTPLEISALHLNDDVCIVHLPGEAFVAYQFFARGCRPDALVTVPAYGDCGPGYIRLERSFAEGSYEPSDSIVAGCSEHLLKVAILQVTQRLDSTSSCQL